MEVINMCHIIISVSLCGQFLGCRSAWRLGLQGEWRGLRSASPVCKTQTQEVERCRLQPVVQVHLWSKGLRDGRPPWGDYPSPVYQTWYLRSIKCQIMENALNAWSPVSDETREQYVCEAFLGQENSNSENNGTCSTLTNFNNNALFSVPGEIPLTECSWV